MTRKIPLKIVFKALLTTSEEIRVLMLEANSDTNCAGLILWMHTFSPSKMWIAGLLEPAKTVLSSAHPIQP